MIHKLSYFLSAFLFLTVVFADELKAQKTSRPMSVENQLLINRVTLNGRRMIQVMLACDRNQVEKVLLLVKRLGGKVHYIDRVVGYVRVKLPTERVLELALSPLIDAFQIASDAKPGWQHDELSRQQVEAQRNAERNSPIPVRSEERKSSLPVISAKTARQEGYTADDGMGIKKWLDDHPSFDGRGVTIALLESGQPEFSHPTIGTARTLGGREVNKLAGIINSVDQADYDDTRVTLNTEVVATSKWTRIGSRTFILPQSGKYLFGIFSINAGGNLVHQFGVLRSVETGEIWVDTDGDADFSNEKPVPSVDQKFEVRSLKLTSPRKTDLGFVVASDKTQSMLHIYCSRLRHQAMTLGIAAGSNNAEGYVSGVAPSARVLLVRIQASEEQLPAFVEGYLMTAARPDVDVLSDSWSAWALPATQRDFAGLIFRRIVTQYNKPIFHAAGNRMMQLSTASAFGDAFTVGGTLLPATFAAIYGRGQIPEAVVHPNTAIGPGDDGGLKPDFLAPEERIAASLCLRDEDFLLPRNQPVLKLPPCYMVSGGTSSSSPFAAGIAALLISAAKQSHIDYSVANLGRALRSSARFLPNQPAHEQGTGVLNIAGAWRELQLGVANPEITITSTTHNNPLILYSNAGSYGQGLYETEGWTAGSEGTRTLIIRRDAGPSAPTTYRISWTGNDGTFSTADSIELSPGKPVPLEIKISPKTATIHSAILNLHDPTSDAIVFRSLNTIVAPERLDARSRSAQFHGTVPLMQGQSNFWYVPRQTAALHFYLSVTRGAVRISIQPPLGIWTDNRMPSLSGTFTFTKGTHHFDFPNPSAGTWSLVVRNDTAWIEKDQKLVSTDDAEYSLKIRSLDASLATDKIKGTNLLIVNNADKLTDPVVRTSWGKLTEYKAAFSRNGIGKQFDINVAAGSSALIVDAKVMTKAGAQPASIQGLDLYLYECTTGQCFLSDLALPAADQQRLIVRNPPPGRWVAMVGSPRFPSVGFFAISGVVVSEKGSKSVPLRGALASGEKRTLPIDNGEHKPFPEAVRVYELFDEDLERSGSENPAGKTLDLSKFPLRHAALAIAVDR
jgi:hypothetical protein